MHDVRWKAPWIPGNLFTLAVALLNKRKPLLDCNHCVCVFAIVLVEDSAKRFEEKPDRCYFLYYIVLPVREVKCIVVRTEHMKKNRWFVILVTILLNIFKPVNNEKINCFYWCNKQQVEVQRNTVSIIEKRHLYFKNNA